MRPKVAEAQPRVKRQFGAGGQLIWDDAAGAGDSPEDIKNPLERGDAEGHLYLAIESIKKQGELLIYEVVPARVGQDWSSPLSSLQRT